MSLSFCMTTPAAPRGLPVALLQAHGQGAAGSREGRVTYRRARAIDLTPWCRSAVGDTDGTRLPKGYRLMGHAHRATGPFHLTLYRPGTPTETAQDRAIADKGAMRLDARAAFDSLAPLATDELLSEKRLSEGLPPAVARARTRVPGRVNDVAFSPTRPLIAVGTGSRRLVLWNYQAAAREQVPA